MSFLSIPILTKTGILMQIQREQSRRIGMMIICYFHISIGFWYGEYLQSLPWLKYCTHKYDILFLLENTHSSNKFPYVIQFGMIKYQCIQKLFSICAHHETISKYNQSIVMHRSAFFLLSTCSCVMSTLDPTSHSILN